MRLVLALTFPLVSLLYGACVRDDIFLSHSVTLGVSEIDFAELRRLGVRAIVMDKDNTLTEPYALAAHPSAHAGLAAVHRHFPNARCSRWPRFLSPSHLFPGGGDLLQLDW